MKVGLLFRDLLPIYLFSFVAFFSLWLLKIAGYFFQNATAKSPAKWLLLQFATLCFKVNVEIFPGRELKSLWLSAVVRKPLSEIFAKSWFILYKNKYSCFSESKVNKKTLYNSLCYTNSATVRTKGRNLTNFSNLAKSEPVFPLYMKCKTYFIR